jgi:hypothetical protein
MAKTALEEGAVIYIEKFRESGIPVPDRGTSYLVIDFCPWCGCRLPLPLSDKWIDAMDKMGVPPPYDKVPEKYETDAWWKDGQFTEGEADGLAEN